jgi:hypothetical protein
MNDQQKKETKALLATAGAFAFALVAGCVAKRFGSRPSRDAPAEDSYVAPKATAKPVYPTQRLGKVYSPNGRRRNRSGGTQKLLSRK